MTNLELFNIEKTNCEDWLSSGISSFIFFPPLSWIWREIVFRALVKSAWFLWRIWNYPTSIKEMLQNFKLRYFFNLHFPSSLEPDAKFHCRANRNWIRLILYWNVKADVAALNLSFRLLLILSGKIKCLRVWLLVRAGLETCFNGATLAAVAGGRLIPFERSKWERN